MDDKLFSESERCTSPVDRLQLLGSGSDGDSDDTEVVGAVVYGGEPAISMEMLFQGQWRRSASTATSAETSVLSDRTHRKRAMMQPVAAAAAVEEGGASTAQGAAGGLASCLTAGRVGSERPRWPRLLNPLPRAQATCLPLVGTCHVRLPRPLQAQGSLPRTTQTPPLHARLSHGFFHSSALNFSGMAIGPTLSCRVPCMHMSAEFL